MSGQRISATAHPLVQEASDAADRKDWVRAAHLLEGAGDSTDVLSQRAFYLSRAKNYDRALTVLAELREREPERAVWPFMTGYQFYAQEKYGEALPWFIRARDRDPSHLRNLYKLAQTLRKLGQTPKAQRTAGEILREWHRMPDETRQREAPVYAKACHMLGVLQEEKDPAGASELFEQAVMHDQGDADKHYKLGKSLRRLGRNAEATRSLERAHQIDPRSDYIAIELAACLAAMDQPERASQCLNGVLGRANGWTAFKAARIALALGEPAAASKFMSSAARNAGVRRADGYAALSAKIRALVPADKTESAHPASSSQGDAGGSGTVHHVRPERAFGFLVDDLDGTRRHFRLQKGSALKAGDKVTFEVKDTEKGPAAINVRPA